jgi:hypothetical protein
MTSENNASFDQITEIIAQITHQSGLNPLFAAAVFCSHYPLFLNLCLSAAGRRI